MILFLRPGFAMEPTVGLGLSMSPKLALTTQSSCLRLPAAQITEVCPEVCHNAFVNVLDYA